MRSAVHLPVVSLVTAGGLLLATSLAGTQPAHAPGPCISGTYLAVEGSGTQSLWTFSSDGTFQATSSASRALNFSQIHGSWKRAGARHARVAGLDFVFRAQPDGAGVPPQAIARLDAWLTFSTDCRQLLGTFELRFYDAPGDDPLDASIPLVGSDTVSGRRVHVP